MPKVTPPEPQSAADYDDRSTAAVKAVLIEIGQILGKLQREVRRRWRRRPLVAAGQ